MPIAVRDWLTTTMPVKHQLESVWYQRFSGLLRVGGTARLTQVNVYGLDPDGCLVADSNPQKTEQKKSRRV